MTGLTAVSLFAGIGGFDFALQRNGVDVVAAVEIDDAARGVLADQFPETTLFTDVREVTGDDLRAAGFVPERGILTAGFPCQDLSVAGNRRGLGEGTRSGLFWEIDRLVADLRPAWLILENVPGLLSATCPCPGTGEHSGCTEPHQLTGGACEGGCFPAHGGAMGLVLGALGDRGYGFAYRVLDAQHFGVPQRRRRVFVVGRAGGDSRGPVEVLLEPEGRAGHPPARREAGEGTSGGSTVSTLQGGGQRGYRIDAEAAAGGHLIPFVAETIRSHPRPGSNSNGALVAATVSAKWAKGTGGPAGDEAQNLVTVASDTAVRRLTPLECERLQGFPDGWTATSNGKHQADAARYRECGNAIAVPVGEWVISGVVQVASRDQADGVAGEVAA